MASSSASSEYPNIPATSSPPPPSFVFPKRSFGSKKIVQTSCQCTWLEQWPWLYYSDGKDTLYCSICIDALKSKKMGKSRGDLAFTVKGFSNWKDDTIGIKKHEGSGSHKEALQVMIVIPSTCHDVGDMLVKQHKQEKKDNWQCLLKILSNVQFLTRQGLPFRGDAEETDSNFIQGSIIEIYDRQLHCTSRAAGGVQK